ncbi:Glucose/ribitol dehydrogenase [Penicillium daleae]|uniref:Glucose/ribitol dehydrogenase n=1 Tax=Penicillium daleae TaxID=63821 RepID=A0AAD6BY60_9EURO|nr:Glucose/ribitol dehydrogenase [Penicillium daleae]KAJ5439054.1 Glucose/ribitol dehydrogenase [Penicillium daleae]
MTTKITEIVDVEDLSRPTNSNEMTNFVPSLHHDTYPFITPTGSELVTKSIFITGASRGLGRATAIRCAKAGCAKIALAARGSLAGVVQEIEETVREAGIPPPQILPLQVDVTSDKSVRAAAKAVYEAFGGKLDILVNNAGHFTKFKPIHEVDPRNADTKIVINLSSMATNCLTYGASAYQVSRFSNCWFSEFVARDYERQSVSLCTLDKANLPEDTVVWLCSQRREWLNARFVIGNWDMEELEKKKSEIVEKDLFKYRITT